MDELRHYTQGLCEVIGGSFLVLTSYVAVAYQFLLGGLSLVSVCCGAFVGLHGVWRLMGYPPCRICRRIWKTPPDVQ